MIENNFWLKVWENNDIPFHADTVKTDLIEFFPSLNLQKDARILVPFCGKSKDLIWLSDQGYEVIGIEISRIACEDFFRELGVQPSIIKKTSCTVYQHNNIQIICADLFNLTKNDFPKIHAIYDCKALIALQHDIKKKYVKHLLSCVDHDIQILLFTIDTEANVQGPPFPISDAETHALYADFEVIKLKKNRISDLPSHLIQKGFREFDEKVFLLK
jgi:thiopurine S-methyltransferase